MVYMSNNSINEPMVTITMTMDQARLLSSVCDIVCRLHLNQFDVIKDVCHRKGQPFPDYDKMQDIEWELKQLFSPELSRNSYWGIYNNQISNDARTLFDMKQQIRNKLAWYSNPLGGWSVDYDEFIQTDHENTPIQVTINTNDPNYEIYLSFFKRFNHSINQMINKMGWQDNSEEVKQWIEACKEFAIHEHLHITTTNTPLPHQEYLDFFNERLTPDGKYIEWDDHVNA